MIDKKLRYEIDSWDQVPQCTSNLSKHLHLTYDIVLDRSLTGSIIRVEHDKYGCLFAYMVESSGNLLDPMSDGMMFELRTEDILLELAKYGFIISFNKDLPVLNNNQYELLCTVNGLGFDRIRVMYVDSLSSNRTTEKERTARLVVFRIESLPDWLNFHKVCTSKEFDKALESGGAINLTQAKGGLKGNNWSFLIDNVLSISDLLDSAR